MRNSTGASAGRPGARASHRAARASRPKASPPRAKEEWHLVCITRKGKVTMLKNLDLSTARETYKRLLPDTRPVKWIDPGCEKCREAQWGFSQGSYMTFGSSREEPDYLSKVEPLGPDGKELDPWHGVEPEVRYNYHCHCPPEPPPPPKWDASRADFWNNPELWNGIDPTRDKCWQERAK